MLACIERGKILQASIRASKGRMTRISKQQGREWMTMMADLVANTRASNTSYGTPDTLNLLEPFIAWPRRNRGLRGVFRKPSYEMSPKRRASLDATICHRRTHIQTSINDVQNKGEASGPLTSKQHIAGILSFDGPRTPASLNQGHLGLPSARSSRRRAYTKTHDYHGFFLVHYILTGLDPDRI